MNRKLNLIITFFILWLIFSELVNSQQNEPKVLTCSGKVEYRTSASQVWKKIQVGESLRKDWEIKLDKNCYAALIFKDKRTLELFEDGIFKIKDLEERLRKSEASVIKKFSNYIVQEIIADKSVKKDMKTFAAVVRVKPNHIDVTIPTFTRVFEPILELAWYNYPSTNKYVLSILNSENTTIHMDLVDDTLFTLDTEKLNLTRGKVYKWFVADADDPMVISDTNSIQVISEAEKMAVLDTLQLINRELESEQSALTIYSLGLFYENNGLNITALYHFKKAILLAPESKEFKNLYVKFLLKQKLYALVSELLEDKLIN